MRRPSSAPTSIGSILLPLLLLATPVQVLAGQSVLERPPNMGGTWVGTSGTVYFNFLHRFTDLGPPTRKVVNYPTFLLGATLPGDLFVGTRYATNSELVPGIPNEWEVLGRWSALGSSDGAPLDLTVQAGYNHAARSGDGELSLARDFGDRLRLLAAGRVFTNAFDRDEARGAWAVGGTVSVSRHVALAGDVAGLFDLEDSEGDVAWSAGLQLGVPYTPHTLSLHVSNASTTTLQGSSLGLPGVERWGFEFTVPFTLSRYFGDGASAAPATPSGPTGEVAAEVGMTNQLSFTPPTVTIQVGETVRWTNSSDIVHTVTADPERAAEAPNVSLPEGAPTFDSGDMAPGAVFEHTFTVAGEYAYICVPHELAGMVGTVIVTEGGS